jgi:hypothetical protein
LLKRYSCLPTHVMIKLQSNQLHHHQEQNINNCIRKAISTVIVSAKLYLLLMINKHSIDYASLHAMHSFMYTLNTLNILNTSAMNRDYPVTFLIQPQLFLQHHLFSNDQPNN